MQNGTSMIQSKSTARSLPKLLILNRCTTNGIEMSPETPHGSDIE